MFATLHTNDAAQPLDRIWDVFPHERQNQIRVQLAASLAGVISQRLVPKVDGGMVAAFEVLLANQAVRNLVREGKTHQLRNVMHGGRAEGMLTLETSLNAAHRRRPHLRRRGALPRSLSRRRSRAHAPHGLIAHPWSCRTAVARMGPAVRHDRQVLEKDAA